ncbi:MAG: capsular polysaccharide biosynthesis protein, partial [Sulfurospirillum sp.]|nr:capsular polysaccharide biosynthesis protein [Sulfurospirillum sp.]
VVSVCDEVHTMTSLVGFEALMRGKKVVTYGMPFYAGWGLTHDMQTSSKRNRTLKLEELIAGTLVCYPRYLDPESLTLCDIEIFLKAFSKRKNAG